MPRTKNQEATRYENWTNFLTKGSKNEYARRWQVFEELQGVMSENTKRPIWREYVGEVMIALMEMTDVKELSELLVLNGYVDLKGLIKICAAMGVEREEAIAKYEQLLLEQKK